MLKGFMKPRARKQKYLEYEQRLLNGKVVEIVDSICNLYSLTSEDFFSGRGTKEVTILRRLLWKALKDMGYTYQQIGIAVKKHHTTVMYQVSKEYPNQYSKAFSKIKALVKAQEKEHD
jgi:chromosomal replication initiation ATPase DnaA